MKPTRTAARITESLRTPHSALRIWPAALCTFFILHSAFFISRAAAQRPVIPTLSGTYYYQGYDESAGHHIYINSTGTAPGATGTYCYVAPDGTVTIGGAATLSASDTAALTILAPQSCNQFQTTTSITLGAGAATGTIYILRDTGTYYLAPGSHLLTSMTFTNTGPDSLDASAFYALGDGNFASTIITGSDLTILGNGTSGNRRMALRIGQGADVCLTDSQVIQTETVLSGTIYYAIYIATGGGRLTGTRILIEANGPQVNALYALNNALTQVILDSSTVRNSGSAAAIRFEGSGLACLSSSVITTTGAFAPAFQAGGGLTRLSLEDSLVHTTGQNSPGLWLGTGTTAGGVMQFTGVLNNSLILSENGAGIDINTNLPGLTTRPGIANPQPHWAGYYNFTIVSSTINGAHGSLRMTSSSTLGATVSEITTMARLDLADSALIGDILVNNRAQLILNAATSRLDGSLRLSGPAPVASLTLADSAIDGGIHLSGAASLALSADNTRITGTLDATDNATASLRLTNHSTIGAIALSGSATLELTMDNTSDILGDFTIQGGATYTLLPADNRSLVFHKPLTIATGGNLRVAPGTNLTLTAPLTLADPQATILIASARGDDLVLAAGLAGDGRLHIQGLHADALGQPSLRVVHDTTNSLTPASFTLAAPASNRLFAYHGLENRPDGAYLVNGGFSSIGAAILDTPALVSADFFETFQPVSRHLAGFREKIAANGLPRASLGDAGTLWLHARTGDTTVDGAAPGLSFRQKTFALSTGADLCWSGGNDSEKPTLLAGIFADTAHTSRNFAADADGRATTYGAGLYGLYRHRAGWHASATVRVGQTDHTLEVRDTNISADYSASSAGANLQFGWLLPSLIPGGWWIEPSIEAGISSHAGATYDTRSTTPSNRFSIKQDPSHATHARAQVALGRDFSNKWGLRARLAAARLDISGGAITGGGVTGANFLVDGTQVEASLGLVCHLSPHSRLWLDCDTSLASNHKRPCTVSLGFSLAW